MVNRDRHEITMEILRKASSGRKKTEIMRIVGISSSQAKLYLPTLVEKGLLQIDEKNSYKTTQKGLKFLEQCEECPLFKWDGRKTFKNLIK